MWKTVGGLVMSFASCRSNYIRSKGTCQRCTGHLRTMPFGPQSRPSQVRLQCSQTRRFSRLLPKSILHQSFHHCRR